MSRAAAGAWLLLLGLGFGACASAPLPVEEYPAMPKSTVDAAAPDGTAVDAGAAPAVDASVPVVDAGAPVAPGTAP